VPTPTSIKKAIKESRLAGAKAKEPEKPELSFKNVPQEEIPHLIEDLENQMELAAKNLEFEKAANLRDEIILLKKDKQPLTKRKK
jgi:excinuclease ABC subunit B